VLSLDSNWNTPLNLAAIYSNSVTMVQELAQLYPAALEMQKTRGDTPLHASARYSTSVDVLRELVSLSPALLMTMNVQGETPLAVAASFLLEIALGIILNCKCS
jgi:hypothetical protein